MTRRRQICQQFVCSHCGAPAGKPCRNLNGSRATAPHAARFTAAVKAGLLPLPRR